MSNEKLIPIILCAGQQGRAVIFGYVDGKPVNGEPVTIRSARMILYWPSECNGLFGVAANGPKDGTRITPTVDETVETVWQEWLAVSPDAARAIAEWPA